MSISIRRVVTGHDANGKAVVAIDEVCKNIAMNRPGYQSVVAWSTGSFPADNTTGEDGGARGVKTTDPNGTVFRIICYEPGVAPRNHRTDSVDYAVILKGEIDMEMDGSTVHLKQGDVLVQRGTIHNWINRGTEACIIAFVLVAANPVERDGNVLHATG